MPWCRTSPDLGLPVDETLKLLAQYLPEIIDKASPNGVLKAL
jgi:uncharacterized protein YidB (DUF937 family)